MMKEVVPKDDTRSWVPSRSLYREGRRCERWHCGRALSRPHALPVPVDRQAVGPDQRWFCRAQDGDSAAAAPATKCKFMQTKTLHSRRFGQQTASTFIEIHVVPRALCQKVKTIPFIVMACGFHDKTR